MPKITALVELTDPVDNDLVAIVDDPAGVPVTKKITLANLLNPKSALPNADFGLANATGVQTAFPATCDVFTLKALTTYFMQGLYILNTGVTTHTTALAFAAGGGLTVTSWEYTVMAWAAAVNAIATAQSTTHVSGIASKVIIGTGIPAYTIIDFYGIVRINAGGTITPQINFSAAPGAGNLMKVGSYLFFTPIGASNVEKTGSVG